MWNYQYKTALAVFALMIIAANSHSHHGWSGYTELMDIEVTVTQLRFGNPHDRLGVQDADGNVWDLLLAPPARNRKFGYDENVISVGDTVQLIAERHPDKLEAKTHFINSLDGDNIYTYYYDSGINSWDRNGN